MKKTEKVILEIFFLLILPIIIGSFLELQTSNFVIFPFAALMILRMAQLYKKGEMSFNKDFQSNKNRLQGLLYYLFFTVISVIIIFLLKDLLILPEWLVNNETWAFLFLHAFLQELIYRTYLINRLKLISRNQIVIAALCAVVFAGIHLLLPFSLHVILLTLISGFVWSLIYQKHPRLLLVTASHFIVNLTIVSWF